MQLIGMLDSPYVRRVAISLKLLGLPFEHRSISVFRQFGYERTPRPVEQHAPWTDRVRGQLGAAFAQLEGELAKGPCAATSDSIT